MTRLSELVDEYVAERQATGHMAEITASTVRGNLHAMARHMACEPDEVTLAKALAWLRSAGGKPSTVAQRVKQARRFFQWLVDCDRLPKNPLAKLETPRVPSGEPKFLERDPVGDLLAVCKSPKDRALVLCAVQMGMRRVELHRALVDDIDWDLLTFAIRGKHHAGEISRRLPIPDQAAQALKEWMIVRPKAGPYVFGTRNGTPMLTGEISKKMADLMRKAGVKKRSGDGMGTHALRHTFAQHLVDSGVEIRVVQAAMGHASVQTTEIYLRRKVEGLRDAMEGRRY